MFMPNPFKSIKDLTSDKFRPLQNGKMIENGYAALRFLLRDLKQSKSKKKVAIPSFTCNSVYRAAIDEGWEIIKLDLKGTLTFWTSYDFEIIKNVDAVIIVHLYGLLHPDTTKIEKFCIKNQIPFIHDCAQASFMNNNKIRSNYGVIYSFNVGKLFTAAGGAMVVKKNIKPFSTSLCYSVITNIKSYVLVRSRMFSNNKSYKVIYTLSSLIESKFRRIGLIDRNQFYVPTKYQLKIISSSVNTVLKNKKSRIKNFRKISSVIAKNNKFVLLNNFPCDSPYKVVFIVIDDPDNFEYRISKENIHFFRLFKTKNSFKGMSFFNDISHKIFEISCELSITSNNINKICKVLNSY